MRERREASDASESEDRIRITRDLSHFAEQREQIPIPCLHVAPSLLFCPPPLFPPSPASHRSIATLCTVCPSSPRQHPHTYANTLHSLQKHRQHPRFIFSFLTCNYPCSDGIATQTAPLHPVLSPFFDPLSPPPPLHPPATSTEKSRHRLSPIDTC